MAAFASFHPLDSSSSSPPSTTVNNMSALFDHPSIALSHFNPYHATNIITTPNNHSSSLLNPTNKNSMDNSSPSVVTNKNNPKNTLQINKKRKSSKEGSSPNSAQSKDVREVKGKKKKVKECKEKKEEAPDGFIHIRARRGQATDSHSLAERVRRERISERMKLLQALVPGCDKVTGKALMLDEIINYVQSLQNQVESILQFLSMKLTSFNPIFYDFGMDLEFMVRPDQDLPPPLPAGMQECSPITATTYPVLDNSVNSLLLHQFQVPNSLPQVDRQVLWEVDDQRHKINNLFSFPLMM